MLLHPLTTPGTRLKPRTDTEITAAHLGKYLSQRVTRNDRWNFGVLRIDIKVYLWQQGCLVCIEYYPIHKVKALIHHRWIVCVCCAEIIDTASASTILYLILWNIDVDKINIVYKQRYATAIIDDHF